MFSLNGTDVDKQRAERRSVVGPTLKGKSISFKSCSSLSPYFFLHTVSRLHTCVTEPYAWLSNPFALKKKKKGGDHSSALTCHDFCSTRDCGPPSSSLFILILFFFFASFLTHAWKRGTPSPWLTAQNSSHLIIEPSVDGRIFHFSFFSFFIFILK